MKKIAAAVGLCLVSLGIHAQNKPGAGFGIEANFLAGKVLKHTVNFKAPVPARTTGAELNFVQKTFGRKDWEQRRNYPVVGFGITFTNYGIDSIYGNCFSVYPNLQLPIAKSRKLEWTFRVGFGLSYVTQRHERNPAWDTVNNAIGSRVNNYTIFATDLRYQLNEHIDLQIGGNFSHVSNASFRIPNLGVNFYGAHIGVRYFPVTSQPQRIVRKLPKLKNRWLAQVRLGISANEYQIDGPLYPVYLLSAFASKRYLSKNKILAGLDYSYHEGIYAYLRNNELHIGTENKHSWKGSVFAGHEFLIGKIGVMAQVGYYLKEAALRRDPYYQKLGCNVYLLQRDRGLLKELNASVLLKTHKIQAELVELGIGAAF